MEKKVATGETSIIKRNSSSGDAEIGGSTMWVKRANCQREEKEEKRRKKELGEVPARVKRTG